MESLVGVQLHRWCETYDHPPLLVDRVWWTNTEKHKEKIGRKCNRVITLSVNTLTVHLNPQHLRVIPSHTEGKAAVDASIARPNVVDLQSERSIASRRDKPGRACDVLRPSIVDVIDSLPHCVRGRRPYGVTGQR